MLPTRLGTRPSAPCYAASGLPHVGPGHGASDSRDPPLPSSFTSILPAPEAAGRGRVTGQRRRMFQEHHHNDL